MKKLCLLTILSSFLISVTSCGHAVSSESIEQTLRTAEDAVVMGDMESACSAASYLFDDSTTRVNMLPSQMARLSMIYMLMADSDDQELNTNRASELYQLAYKTNADSADAFYKNVASERMQYVESLSNHVANRNNPVDVSSLPDEMEMFEDDTIPALL